MPRKPSVKEMEKEREQEAMQGGRAIAAQGQAAIEEAEGMEAIDILQKRDAANKGRYRGLMNYPYSDSK